MPLIHRAGEAQVDFGYALAKVSGDLRKVAFFVTDLQSEEWTSVAYNILQS